MAQKLAAEPHVTQQSESVVDVEEAQLEVESEPVAVEGAQLGRKRPCKATSVMLYYQKQL